MENSYSKSVDTAYNLHVSGKFKEALFLYEKLLEVNPDDVNVLNLYAQLNMSLKNYDKALQIFNKIYATTKLDSILVNIAQIYFFKNDFEAAINTLKDIKQHSEDSVRLFAISYLKLGNNERAIANYKALAENKLANSFDLYNLAFLYSLQNNTDEALKFGLLAHSLQPDDVEINRFLAGIYSQLNDEKNQLLYLLNVEKVQPDTDVLFAIGVIYMHLEDDSNAIKYFNEVQNIDPNNRKALLCIANIYKKHDIKVSISIYERLYNLDNNDENAVLNLNNLYTKIFDFENALKWAKRYYEISEEKSLGLSMIADAFMELYKYKEAEEYYYKSFQADSSNDRTKLHLAYLYSYTNRVPQAFEMLKKVSTESRLEQDYSLVYLRDKKIEDVYEGYYHWYSKVQTSEIKEEKARKMFYKLNVNKKYGISEELFAMFRKSSEVEVDKMMLHYLDCAWKTQNIQDKKLLIYSSHGVGDLFMFSRYVFEVLKQTKNIILKVPSSCISFMKYNFPELKILNNNDFIEDKDYDYTSDFMLLLYPLRASLKNIPCSKGYLTVSEEAVKEKSNFDFMKTKKKKVGIFWQGNPTVYVNRSVKLKYLLPLFEVENLQIYSFQLSAIDVESENLKKGLSLVDLAPHIKNYEDTAAFLKNIDVLVTIDTSIANLAGAMGVKTFLMLPYMPEWRWFYDTETTPWYDSVKIFKQKIPGDWAEVVARIKNEISL